MIKLIKVATSCLLTIVMLGCGTTENISISTTSSNQTGIIDTDYCKNLLRTSIYRWTSECSVRTGTGSQIRQSQPIKYSNQTEVDFYIKKLPTSNLPTCAGEVSLQWGSIIHRDWSNCNGTLIFSRSDTLSASTYKEEKYIGVFKDGKADGFGSYFYDTGNVYIGQFQNGQSHGQGILISIDPKLNKEGIWEKNVFKYSQKINLQSTSIAEVDQKLKTAETNKAQTVNKVESSPAIPISASPLTQTPIAPAAFPPIMNPGKRVALVIGNQTYSVRPLLNPRNDADDMSRVLKNAGVYVA